MLKRKFPSDDVDQVIVDVGRRGQVFTERNCTGIQEALTAAEYRENDTIAEKSHSPQILGLSSSGRCIVGCP